ncbi:hypothetical protein FA15DRAFT_717182, partial [Coprinopsis marcescibilis]
HILLSDITLGWTHHPKKLATLFDSLILLSCINMRFVSFSVFIGLGAVILGVAALPVTINGRDLNAVNGPLTSRDTTTQQDLQLLAARDALDEMEDMIASRTYDHLEARVRQLTPAQRRTQGAGRDAAAAASAFLRRGRMNRVQTAGRVAAGVAPSFLRAGRMERVQHAARVAAAFARRRNARPAPAYNTVPPRYSPPRNSPPPNYRP